MSLLNSIAPQQGDVVVSAPGKGKGFWSGGHSAFHDEATDTTYLYWRERRPRSEAEPWRRGARCSIASCSGNGKFETIWEARKSDFDAISIEKGSLVRAESGRFRLYLSYESAATGRWQIDLMEAERPSQFDPASRSVFLQAGDVEAAHVKDPNVVMENGRYFIFANYTFADGPRESTLLVHSADGRSIDRIQKTKIVPAGAGAWDDFSSRLTGVLAADSGYYLFYDGNSWEGEVCEDSCGCYFAEAPDSDYRKLSVDEPLWPGVRYMFPLATNRGTRFFYEYTLPDGAHELRACESRRDPADAGRRAA